MLNMKLLPTLNLIAVILFLGMTGNLQIIEETNAAPSEEETGTHVSPKISTIKKWGKSMDVDGDCKFFISNESLLISVPGLPNPHDLAAEIGTTNAPRVLQTVSGDFTVEVQVDGRFAPGKESTLPGRVGYNGAGLVIMSGPQNVVCLARAVMNHPDDKPKPYANFEMRADGDLERIGDANVHPLPVTGPVFLRLSRQRQKISAAVSTDGKTWEQLQPKELPMGWPKKLQVGVVAISTSTDEFNPRFSHFKIVK